ncbi:MAG: ABC transporter substrate-binding protein, partial [Pseudomonadota bacterium]
MSLLRALVVCLALPAQAEVAVYPAPQGGDRELVVYSSLDSPLARPLIEAFQVIRPDVSVRYEDLLAGEIAAR